MMKHQHLGMLIICVVMMGAGLLFITRGGGNGLWLLLPMLGCMAIHLVMHRKMDSGHEHKPPE